MQQTLFSTLYWYAKTNTHSHVLTNCHANRTAVYRYLLGYNCSSSIPLGYNCSLSIP